MKKCHKPLPFSRFFVSCILGSALLLESCSLAPRFALPEVPVVEEWKTETTTCNNPTPYEAPCDFWWQVFNDEALNRLEFEAMANSPTLELAMAKLREARAQANMAFSDRFPTVDLVPAYANTGELFQLFLPPGGLGLPATDQFPTIYRIHAFNYALPLVVNYELDLWGKHKNGWKAANAHAHALAYDYCASLLILTTDVAVTYYRMRLLDAQIAIVGEQVQLQHNLTTLSRNNYNRGLTDIQDLLSQEKALSELTASLKEAQRERSEYENLLATLIGVSAPSFEFPFSPLETVSPPTIPAGIPASVLGRRPDIAEAAAEVARFDASIGVARAELYPTIGLTAGLGMISPQFHEFMNWSSRYWSIGANVFQSIFDAGKRKAHIREVCAQYDQTVATYKQKALTAFQEVENALSNIQRYREEFESFQKASSLSDQQAQIAFSRTNRGLTAQTQSLISQQNALSAKYNALGALTNEYVSTIYLIKAIGGSWDADCF